MTMQLCSSASVRQLRTPGFSEPHSYLLLSRDDNTFFNQVLHKTRGGQLPFLFQPDSNYNNPDGFAICKFDMKEFKFEQVANGVYKVKLKIREVW